MVPQDACYSMQPSHNQTRPQSSALPPFEIVVHKNSYLPDDRVKITLTGLLGARFKGFMLQARTIGGSNILGSWTFGSLNELVPANEFIGILKCMQNNNTLVHAWPEFYDQSRKYFDNITAFWVPPAFSNVDVEFVATIVQRYDTYWTNVKSRVLTASKLLSKNNSPRTTSVSSILLTLPIVLILGF